MSKLDKYKTVIPAFYACYDDEGNISTERIRKLAKYFLNKGIKGLYVGGSSGECIYQNVAERKLVLETVVEAIGDEMLIIAHVAASSTRDSIELAEHAEKLGVDALAAIPPIYFVLQEHAIKAYWTSILEATELDFIIYNIPQTTGYSLSVKLFQEMMANKQVIGVKNSSMPVQDINNFKIFSEKPSIVFNGPDEQFVGGRVMGAEGGIGGTYGVMPELFIAMDQHIKNNEMAQALAIQNQVNLIIAKLTSCKGNIYAVIKKVLELQGVNIGGVREPLPNVEEQDFSTIKECYDMIEAAKASLV
ncbi:dihydrodipicolinate synthase family protein [Vagococcus elongatus]|uniref:N-acetylneuraminate lyase n=1 Tax=Vagococcus elongatus TaxID=180344 RepID=A0A430AQC4_9ENTE|nr:dihydrodipicolinate synthase family protein [Vagococcus elongatus]RSU10331.1 N-acetylneuraminate lyase [Vagococcus elongatus]